jgi:hypothetical protein
MIPDTGPNARGHPRNWCLDFADTPALRNVAAEGAFVKRNGSFGRKEAVTFRSPSRTSFATFMGYRVDSQHR